MALISGWSDSSRISELAMKTFRTEFRSLESCKPSQGPINLLPKPFSGKRGGANRIYSTSWFSLCGVFSIKQQGTYNLEVDVIE